MNAPGRVVAVNATGECSGAESVLVSLLAMATSRGDDVVVVSPVGPLVDRLPAGVRHVPIAALVPTPRPGALGRARAALALVRAWATARRVVAGEVGASGTHTIVNSLWALPVVRGSRPASTFVWLVHDTVHTRRQRLLVRLGTRRRRRGAAARAVAVSEATAAPLRALGLDVVVRPNGVTWPVDAVDAGTLHEPPVIGMLALLTPWKGHRVLLEAAARLPAVRVELAGGQFPGDEAYVAELHARAGVADLAGRVRFLGAVDALATMAGWDVFVSASTSPEAGPLGVLEAMSLGLPVVVSDLGGAPEYVGDGGVAVPAGDVAALASAIDHLLGDADGRRQLGDRARARVAAQYDAASTRERLYEAAMAP